MTAYFVTSTGTGIGKTFVTAGLIRALRDAGKPVDALKPVVSGFDIATSALSDPGVLLEALDEPVTPEGLLRVSPWQFAAPLSPDMAAVAGVIRVPQVMVVTPQLPAKTVPEFIAYAKANPGKINMGSGGVGSTLHVAGELFKMMAGVNLVHVPYRGDAPALVDLMGGQIQVMFDLTAAALPFIRAGKIRGLAVTSAARTPSLPDLPPIGDVLPGYEATSFEGIAAPKNTPVEIVDRLNKAINAGFADQRFKARLADLGGEGMPGTPADFTKVIADETEKWGKVVKFAGLKAE